MLCFDENKFESECKYENPTGGQHDPSAGNLFPHIYGPSNISAVIKVLDFPSNENGFFTLPKELKIWDLDNNGYYYLQVLIMTKCVFTIFPLNL